VAIPAFLDDYAFLTWALIELYDATHDPTHLDHALQLQEIAEGLGCETGLATVAGSVESDNKTISRQLVVANPLDSCDVLDAGRGALDQAHTGKESQKPEKACVFHDGSECDSWDFLAGRCGQEHSHCVDQGYEIQAIEDSNIANCIFDDGSTCSEYLYFQGECKPGENYP